MNRVVIVICDSLRTDLITPRRRAIPDRARPALGAVREPYGRVSFDHADECRLDRDRVPAGAARPARQHDGARRGRRARLPVGRQARFPRSAIPRDRPDPARADPGRAARPRRRDRDRILERLAGGRLFPRPRWLWLGLQPRRQLWPRPAPVAGRRRAGDRQGRRRRHGRDRAVLRGGAAATARRPWRSCGSRSPTIPDTTRRSARPSIAARSAAPTPMCGGSPKRSRHSIRPASASSSSSAPTTAWRRSTRRSISIALLVDAGLKAAPGSSDVVVAPNGTAALLYFADPAGAPRRRGRALSRNPGLGRPDVCRQRARRGRITDGYGRRKSL